MALAAARGMTRSRRRGGGHCHSLHVSFTRPHFSEGIVISAMAPARTMTWPDHEPVGLIFRVRNPYICRDIIFWEETRMSRTPEFRVILCRLAAAERARPGRDRSRCHARRSGSFGSRGSRTYPPHRHADRAQYRCADQPLDHPAASADHRPRAPRAPRRAAGRIVRTARASWAACSQASSAPDCSACCSAAGLFGGLGGFASFLGLMLQVALVVIVARLIWSWWQRRNAPAYASAGASVDA